MSLFPQIFMSVLSQPSLFGFNKDTQIQIFFFLFQTFQGLHRCGMETLCFTDSGALSLSRMNKI